MQIEGEDLFGVAARRKLGVRLPELPERSRKAIEQELATLDFLNMQIESAEQRLEAIMQVSVEADLLKTLPCVGKILSMVLMLGIGRVDRFSDRRAPGQRRRSCSASAFQRWSHAHGAGVREREPESKGGVCRDRQPDRVVRLYQRIKRAKITRRRWSPWRATWPKPLGGC